MPALVIRGQRFEWGRRTYLMGVLNVTTDSFSDGGEFNTDEAALAQALAMTEEGADIIDVGGQSTRPGAESVSLSTELDRVISVLQVIRPALAVPISVDTTKAAVAASAVAAGADLVNDISGGTFDRDMFSTVAKLNVPIILMHMRGNPQTMTEMTIYQDLFAEISSFLAQQIAAAIAAGIDREKIMIDPGIGFAKNQAQNLEILRHLAKLKALNCPILVGSSRKSFLGRILNQPDPKARIWGTAATSCCAISQGADILRVHDVREMRDVCLVADAIYRS